MITPDIVADLEHASNKDPWIQVNIASTYPWLPEGISMVAHNGQMRQTKYKSVVYCG